MIQIFSSNILNKHNNTFLHFFTTRLGGISKKPFHYANLGIFTKDPNTLSNLKILSKQIGIEIKQFVFQKQIHSDNISIVNSEKENPMQNSDAMITNKSQILLNVITADCVPLLLADKKNKIISVIHAGWRGTSKLITYKTIKKLTQTFSSNPKDIIAVIGPSIGPCCYTIGEEVMDDFIQNQGSQAKKFFIYKNNNLYLDLWKSNLSQLLEAKIKLNNIEVMKICTSCHNDTFFSARRGDQGRQIAGIMIK